MLPRRAGVVKSLKRSLTVQQRVQNAENQQSNRTYKQKHDAQKRH